MASRPSNPRNTVGMQCDRNGAAFTTVPSLAHALWFVCQAQVARSDTAAVMNTATELLKISEEHGLPQTRAIASVYLGWAVGQTNDVAQGIRYLAEGLAAWNRLGARGHLCLAFCL